IVTENLKVIPGVVFQYRLNKKTDRVTFKIGGYVADPDFATLPMPHLWRFFSRHRVDGRQAEVFLAYLFRSEFIRVVEDGQQIVGGSAKIRHNLQSLQEERYRIINSSFVVGYSPKVTIGAGIVVLYLNRPAIRLG